MKKRFVKNLTVFSSLVTLLFVLSSSDVKKKNPLDAIKIVKGKIEYSSGTIYIGDEYYLKKVKELGLYDVLVLDSRRARDPNLKIYNSYKIRDDLIREEIIDGLLKYEEVYPTKWERSKESLILEWSIHNVMHDLGYRLDHTTDVDLNNEDEETYLIRNKKK